MENQEINLEELNEQAFTYKEGETVKLFGETGDLEEGYIVECDMEERVIVVQFPCSGGRTRRFRSLGNGRWKTGNGEDVSEEEAE